MPYSFLRILFDPQGGEGGVSDPPVVPDLQKASEGLIAKHGDPTAALRVLLSENYSYRDQIRELKGKVPGDGTVVLAGDDAKRWNTYRDLGEPNEIKKGLSERDQYKTESDKLRRTEANRTVAKLVGMNEKAFARLAEQDGLDFETKDTKSADGKSVPTVYVKGIKDDEGKDKPTTLAEYAEKHWDDMMPALTGGKSTDDQNAGPSRRMPAPREERQTVPPPPNTGGNSANRDRALRPLVR